MIGITLESLEPMQKAFITKQPIDKIYIKNWESFILKLLDHYTKKEIISMFEFNRSNIDMILLVNLLNIDSSPQMRKMTVSYSNFLPDFPSPLLEYWESKQIPDLEVAVKFLEKVTTMSSAIDILSHFPQSRIMRQLLNFVQYKKVSGDIDFLPEFSRHLKKIYMIENASRKCRK